PSLCRSAAIRSFFRAGGEGMKSVDSIARVRRAFYVQGWSLKRISRELHLSRNTIRKILRSDETEFTYERERQPMPKIGRWQDQLGALLGGSDGMSASERLTLIRIYEELRELGYEGGYDAIRRYARSWMKARGSAMAEAYVPLLSRRARPISLTGATRSF